MHRHRRMNRHLAIFALLLSLTVTASAALFGPNLILDPGFEETDVGSTSPDWKLIVDKPEAATLSTVETDVVAGKRALSLEIAEPDLRGEQTALQSPIIPCEPGWYILSFWYRHDFTGEAQPDRRFEIERLLDVSSGTRDDIVYQYYNEHPTVSGEWNRTFLVFRVRPGQEGVRFQFASWSPNETRFLLDSLSLRKIDQSTLAGPAIEEPNIIKGGLAADPVEDTAASDERAYLCEEGKHVAGDKVIWRAENTLSPGLYRLRFRLRQEQAPASEAEPVMLTANGDNGSAKDTVRATDFKGTTDYESFDLVFFYPFGEGHCINWVYPGKGIYRFDNISAEKVADVSMQEAWSILADGVKPR